MMDSNKSFSIIHFLISDSPLPASPVNNGEPLKTDEEKIKYIFDRFYSEYYIPNKGNKQRAMSEWLSGLALDIEYYYDDIVNLAIKMGSIDPNPNDKLRNKVQQGYFKLFRRYQFIEVKRC